MNKALNSDDLRRKRLKFRSWHRGWKETDLILGQFADQYLGCMSDSGLAVYEQLLEEDDAVIWAWVTGKESPPTVFANIINKLTPV